MQVVEDTMAILSNYPDLEAQVIAASIRHPMHVTYAAMAGAEVATVPYAVLMQMIQHPLTDIGIKRFLADWKSVAKK
jgi:transaldolase